MTTPSARTGVTSEQADRLMERLDAAYMACPSSDDDLARLLMDALLWVRNTAPAPVATPTRTWTCIARTCSDVEHPWSDWITATREMGQHAQNGEHDARWPVTFRLGPVAPGAVPEVTYCLFDAVPSLPGVGE